MPPKFVHHKGIVSLDPSYPVHPEVTPLIADILRTKCCVQGSVFLVEAIDKILGDRARTVTRLVLGDGELAIQGFLERDMLWVVEKGNVFEGGYVRLDKFELGEVVVEEEEEGGGKEFYLVIGDLRTVGWDVKYLNILKSEGLEVKNVRELMERKEEVGGRVFGLEARAREMMERKRREREEEEERERKMEEERRRKEEEERKRREEEEVAELIRLAEEVIEETDDEVGIEERDEDYISESDYEDDVFERMEFSPQKATPRRAMVAEGSSINDITTPPRPPPFKLQPRQPRVSPQPSQTRRILTPKPPRPPPQPQPQNTTPKALPWNTDNPFQPLKLTRLSQLGSLPYKQNWKLNALVVVTQLGEPGPCPFPPHIQRQARVIEQSTEGRHVHLTVFLDPENFTPRLGEIYLLLGVKNHQFEGGSLKKYASDKPKGRAGWWVEGHRLGWCQGMVEDLREWWAQHPDNGKVVEGVEGAL
ncbi:hypothetical protein QBC40DRAFT_329156 [Triangularia verruculosa]|uniref:Uncharacterized protein n=1 Tax=Triangularia verruculosa TaxID=2587418 RepID=A0AAN7AYY1_9PEZI|nr:hypothetical protein QBC40DRAFT_329156 [Triangularia verruculosa]